MLTQNGYKHLCLGENKERKKASLGHCVNRSTTHKITKPSLAQLIDYKIFPLQIHAIKIMFRNNEKNDKINLSILKLYLRKGC